MIVCCAVCNTKLNEEEFHLSFTHPYLDEVRLKPFYDDCEPLACSQFGKIESKSEQFLDIKLLYLCSDCKTEKENYEITYYNKL